MSWDHHDLIISSWFWCMDSELNSLTSTSQYFFCILKRGKPRIHGDVLGSGTEHTFVC